MVEYLNKLQDNILEHRYRYYVLDHPVISDFEYDWIEKYFINLCQLNNFIHILIDHGIGFNTNQELYKAAKYRVDNNLDNYSLWEKDMIPIWKKIGCPKYSISHNN